MPNTFWQCAHFWVGIWAAGTSHVGSLTWTLPQKYWQDLVFLGYFDTYESPHKFSCLILWGGMWPLGEGGVSSLNFATEILVRFAVSGLFRYK